MNDQQRAEAGWVLLCFAIIYLVWGSTFVAIRLAVEELPPLLMAGGRFLVAGLALCVAATVLAKEITIFKDKVRIDVQTKTPGIDFGGAWKRRLTMRHEGQEFHVLSKPDLIASKRASGRPVDLEDVRMLEGDAG